MLKKLLDKFTKKSKNKKENSSIETVFVYESEEVEINPKYIKPSDYQQLVALEKFIKAHEELSDEEILRFIGGKNKMFVAKLGEVVPNFVQELRKNGAKSVALIYISDKLYSNKTSI